MIIDCVSDLHGHYPELAGGDLLIVAGDLAASDKAQQFVDFFIWIDKQNYRKKIVIAGNHDNVLQMFPPIQESLPENISYLCDSGTEFEELKIWGSPWTKSFEDCNPRCKAFMLNTEEELAEKWDLIPRDIDILITHSPPYGVMDTVNEVTKWGTKQFNVGSLSLAHKFRGIKGHKLHIFGHIHEGYGIKTLGPFFLPSYVNASYVNEHYQPVNKPIRYDTMTGEFIPYPISEVT